MPESIEHYTNGTRSRGPLEGQVAAVVGAGRGLGRAVARGLAADGAAVVAVARTRAEIDAAVAEIAAAGGEARSVVADASVEADADLVVAAALEWWGRLDILVSCAGAALIKPLLEVSLAEWEHIFAANARTVFLTNRAALRPMLAAGRGLIVNVASRAGITGAPNVAAYTAAKAAVIGFSRALALEVKPRGVRVVCLAPAPMDTPMRWAATPAFDASRLISAEAVADLVRYLARHRDVVFDDPAVPMSVRL